MRSVKPLTNIHAPQNNALLFFLILPSTNKNGRYAEIANPLPIKKKLMCWNYKKYFTEIFIQNQLSTRLI